MCEARGRRRVAAEAWRSAGELSTRPAGGRYTVHSTHEWLLITARHGFLLLRRKREEKERGMGTPMAAAEINLLCCSGS